MENVTNIDQQVELLRNGLNTAKLRFHRWFVTCFAFSIVVSLLAVFTKSIFFGAVAGFGWFFAWNRWKCRELVSGFLSGPSLSNDQERARWVNAVRDSALHPPSWWTRSENLSGLILIALFAIVTAIVVSSSGFWMRLWYAGTWGMLVLYVLRRIKYARASRKNK